MDTRELPLILFTLLTQIAVGMAVFAALRQWATVEGPTIKSRNEWITILALIGLGVFAAFFHLGKPLGAIYLVFTKASNGWLFKATALVGLLAVFSTGMAYASAGLDAIDNVLPLILFMLTVFTLGPAIASYFVDEKSHAGLVSILVPTLLTSVSVRFVVPFVWLSGNVVMRTSGQNFLASPLHWLHIAALLVGVMIVRPGKSLPKWLPVVLLIGELLGRIAFFALVSSSGSNIGGMY
jgi:DMSO reductase anchor subunit